MVRYCYGQMGFNGSITIVVHIKPSQTMLKGQAVRRRNDDELIRTFGCCYVFGFNVSAY